MFWRKCHQRCLHGPQTHCLLKRQRLSVHWCISNKLSWNECGMNHNNNLGDGHSLCSSDVSRSGTTTRLMSLISVFHTLAAAAWQCFVHRLCFWKGIFFFFFLLTIPDRFDHFIAFGLLCCRKFLELILIKCLHELKPVQLTWMNILGYNDVWFLTFNYDQEHVKSLYYNEISFLKLKTLPKF